MGRLDGTYHESSSFNPFLETAIVSHGARIAIVSTTCCTQQHQILEASKMSSTKDYTAAEHQLTQILLTELLAYVTSVKRWKHHKDNPRAPKMCYLTWHSWF